MVPSVVNIYKRPLMERLSYCCRRSYEAEWWHDALIKQRSSVSLSYAYINNNIISVCRWMCRLCCFSCYEMRMVSVNCITDRRLGFCASPRLSWHDDPMICCRLPPLLQVLPLLRMCRLCCFSCHETRMVSQCIMDRRLGFCDFAATILA